MEVHTPKTTRRSTRLRVEIPVNVTSLDRMRPFAERCMVPPGLTGIAQIYAPRDVSRRQKFRLDLLYIRRRSLMLDLRLILLSFWITVRGTWEQRERKY